MRIFNAQKIFYCGEKSASDDSSCDATANSNEDSELDGETLKDRNRRLLIQERESQGRIKIRLSKESGTPLKPSPRLSTIKEEDGSNTEKGILLEAKSDSAAEVSVQDDISDDKRILEIERRLKQRSVKRRLTSRLHTQSKSKKNSSMVNRRGLIEQTMLPAPVSKFI